MTLKDEIKNSRWAYFRGYIVTCNVDGSIPLNAKVVLDRTMYYSGAPDDQSDIVIACHNEMLCELEE